MLPALLGGGLLTGIFAVIANAMGWIRFSKKDTADISKVNSETTVTLADANNKKIDDEVKISKAALEWTVQLAGQLERCNAIGEKKQAEIEAIRVLMQELRDELRLKIENMDALLDKAQKELSYERALNKELLEKIKSHMNG